jgi:oligosaccharide repeat unit polymerase
MDIGIALIVDICLLIGSLWLILQVSELSIFNPSLWWVALHAYSVTYRLVTLNLGVPSLTIRSDIEMVNAAIASDITLLAVVGATLFVAYKNSGNKASNSIESRWSKLNPRAGEVISILCLTIGTYALIAFSAVTTAARARGADISAIDIGRFDESSYPGIIGGFAVQGALIQCAIHGFTRLRVILLMLMIALISINSARTSFVIAAILAFMIYQTKRKQHSLPMKWAVCVVLLGLLWFVYKPVSQGIVAGEGAEAIWTGAQNYFQDSVGATPSIDTQFLDMQAAYMNAADEAGVRFYGATLLPLVYFPIPRFVWPDKPTMSEAARQLGLMGMTPNLSGEAYIEFGWIGCAIIPFLYIYGMQTAFQRVSRLGITSIARWIYLIFLVSMLQVFRDGLMSLFAYPFVVYLPLLSWGAISRPLSANRAGVRHLKPHNASLIASRRVG